MNDRAHDEHALLMWQVHRRPARDKAFGWQGRFPPDREIYLL